MDTAWSDDASVPRRFQKWEPCKQPLIARVSELRQQKAGHWQSQAPCSALPQHSLELCDADSVLQPAVCWIQVTGVQIELHFCDPMYFFFNGLVNLEQIIHLLEDEGTYFFILFCRPPLEMVQ